MSMCRSTVHQAVLAGRAMTFGARPSRWHGRWLRSSPTNSPTRGGRKSEASGSLSTSIRTLRTRRCLARGRSELGLEPKCLFRSPGINSMPSIATRSRSRPSQAFSPSTVTRGRTCTPSPRTYRTSLPNSPTAWRRLAMHRGLPCIPNSPMSPLAWRPAVYEAARVGLASTQLLDQTARPVPGVAFVVEALDLFRAPPR